MMQHQANTIERKINTALLSLRKVMDQQKEQPVLASSCDHTYDDKFALAEEVVTLAVASFLGVLEGLGLDRASIVKLAALARSVEPTPSPQPLVPTLAPTAGTASARTK